MNLGKILHILIYVLAQEFDYVLLLYQKNTKITEKSTVISENSKFNDKSGNNVPILMKFVLKCRK